MGLVDIMVPDPVGVNNPVPPAETGGNHRPVGTAALTSLVGAGRMPSLLCPAGGPVE